MSADNLSDIPQESLILPGFISSREGGVFVDLPNLQKNGGFELFVDRVFAGGLLFSQLDYGCFLKLLYDTEWLAATQAQSPELKLAAGIACFLPARRSLYRVIKQLDGGKYAEYVFEPVTIEEIYEEPVYGDPDKNGVSPIIKMVSKTRQLPSKLNFDEFVADMWLKGVKFGIDQEIVRRAIADGTSARVMMASYLEPTAGRDARTIEVFTGLRCDNSPKILANGRADLQSRKNRFPQITKGTPLLKKVPRALGRPGFKVTGEVIEPEIPKDLDLSALASSGTCVKQCEDGEYIVSALDGFLMFDQQTNEISVSEKIENMGGVSAQTTGNLVLDVDEYVEHGEVQEGCVVKGKHMTFLSDVFGGVVSQGGNISIAQNLSGGSAESFGGNITLSAQASRAMVRACDGEVTVDYCENSTIIGRIVRVQHAVNCELIADELFASVIEGCVIAAKNIRITSTNERRNHETLVTVLVPDCSVCDKNIANKKNEIAETQKMIVTKAQQMEVLRSDVEFAKYLGLYGKIKSGAIKLNDEQAVNWRKMMIKNAGAADRLAKLNAETSALNESLKKSEDELAAAMRDRDEKEGGISCVIDTVLGQTTVQTMKSANGIGALSGLPGKGIRDVLQKVDSHKVRLFSDDTGSVNWNPKIPQDS